MTSSSDKRVKTVGNKRKENEHIYSYKFLFAAHERHFLIVEDRRLLMEHKVGIIPSLAPQFGRELDSRNWRNLASYPTPANIVVVKEFYTNSWTMGGEKETYNSYVRGKKISFDADTINNFLGTDWERKEVPVCTFFGGRRGF